MQKPWELDAALHHERITAVAEVIFDARSHVLDLRDEDNGDDNWAVGCRSNSWCRTALSKHSEAGTYPWLRVVNPNLDFLMLIDGIPVRLARDDPYTPSGKALRKASLPQRTDYDQFYFSFPESWSLSQVHWVFIVETGTESEVLSVSLLGVLPWGEIIARHVVPTIGFVRTFRVVEPETTAIYEPPEPVVTRKLPKPDQAHSNDTETDESSGTKQSE